MVDLKATLYYKQCHAEKIPMKKTIKMHEERNTKRKSDEKTPQGALPAFLPDREGQSRAEVLSGATEQERKGKAGKWGVPLPEVCAQGETDTKSYSIRKKKKYGRGWLPKSALGRASSR